MRSVTEEYSLNLSNRFEDPSLYFASKPSTSRTSLLTTKCLTTKEKGRISNNQFHLQIDIYIHESFTFVNCLLTITLFLYFNREVAAAAPVTGGERDLLTSLKEVLKKALIHDGLARGLHECAKALDRRQAHLCVLSSSCTEPGYTR